MRKSKANKKQSFNTTLEDKLVLWLAELINSSISVQIRRKVLCNALLSSMIIAAAAILLDLLADTDGSMLSLGGSLIICIGIMSAFELQDITDTLRSLQAKEINKGKQTVAKSEDPKMLRAALRAEGECKEALEDMIKIAVNPKTLVYSVFLTIMGTLLCGLSSLLG